MSSISRDHPQLVVGDGVLRLLYFSDYLVAMMTGKLKSSTVYLITSVESQKRVGISI